MKATLLNIDTRKLRELFIDAKSVSDFIEANSDVGYYYSPTVERGTRTFVALEDRRVHVVDFLRVEFPSSTLIVYDGSVIVDGRRGSVEDCLVPILLAGGVSLLDRRWTVVTTRPDVPWYERAGVADA